VRGEVSSFRRWCTNRVKVGKSIDASKFESDLLALDTRERIVKAIVDSGGTVAAIASTFNAVEKASTEASIKSSAQRRYRRVMKSHFSELADALSAHLHTGITATEGE
jgi:predicted metal-dependent hydrolase